MINKNFYRKFVLEFCKKLQQIPEECHPESGIFIPYTFDKYTEAEKKIFFVGIDTAGWIKTTEMLNDFSNNNIDSYLEKNSKVVTVQGENQDVQKFIQANSASMATDHDEAPVFLARNAWHLNKAVEDFPSVNLLKIKE